MPGTRHGAEQRRARDTGPGPRGRAGSASAINAAAPIGPTAATAKAVRQPNAACSAPAIHSERLLPTPKVDV